MADYLHDNLTIQPPPGDAIIGGIMQNWYPSHFCRNFSRCHSPPFCWPLRTWHHRPLVICHGPWRLFGDLSHATPRYWLRRKRSSYALKTFIRETNMMRDTRNAGDVWDDETRGDSNEADLRIPSRKKQTSERIVGAICDMIQHGYSLNWFQLVNFSCRHKIRSTLNSFLFKFSYNFCFSQNITRQQEQDREVTMRHVHCHSLSNDENTNQNKQISSYLNSLVIFLRRRWGCFSTNLAWLTVWLWWLRPFHGVWRASAKTRWAHSICGHPPVRCWFPSPTKGSDGGKSRVNLIRFVNSTHLFESTRPLFQDFFKGRARREAFHFLFFLVLVLTVLLHGFLQFGFLVQNGFPPVKSQRQKKNISNQ